jgi:hypothetical protein
MARGETFTVTSYNMPGVSEYVDDWVGDETESEGYKVNSDFAVLPSQPPTSGATCWLRRTTTPPTRYRPLRAKLPHPLGSIPLWPSRNGRGCAALACYRSCGGGNDVIVAHRD